MRIGWSRGLSAVVVVASVSTGIAAFQINPDVITQVSTAAPSLWLPAQISGEIVRVDGTTGEVTGRVEVAEPGADLDLEERGSGVVVVDRSAGRVSLVDPALDEVSRFISTSIVDVELVDIGPEAVVIAAQDSAAIVDIAVTEASALELDAMARSVAADDAGGVVALADEILMSGSDGTQARLPGEDSAVVRAGGRVMELVGQRVQDLEGQTRGCLFRPLSVDAQLIGTDSGLIVVADEGFVQLVDTEAGTCLLVDLRDSADTLTVLGRPAMAQGHVFVPEPATGVVHIVDPSTKTAITHRVAFGTTELRVRSRGDLVMAYDATSSFAAVLSQSGVVFRIDTSADDRGEGAVLGDAGSAAVVGGDEDTPAVGLDGLEGDDATAVAGATIDSAVLAATDESPAVTEPLLDLPTTELVASFAFSTTTAVIGEVVRFIDESSGDPNGWIWDFGDGSGSQGPEVEKFWAVSGTYVVTLRISRDTESAEVSVAVTVVPKDVPLPPSADFVFSASAVDVGTDVLFEDRSAGEIDRWRWDFGDGSFADTSNAAKSWATPGRYTVLLTVANDQGSDAAFVVIDVVQGLTAPVAALSASTELVEVGAPVDFEAISLTDPASFSWDFGDGRTSSGAEVVHVFLDEGDFEVEVVAENDAGQSSAVVTITVVPATLPPVAFIASLPSIVEVGDVVAFASLSTNGPDTEQWVFGDGLTASGTTVDHSWTAPGSYLVTLTAANRAGSASTSVTVDVLAELPTPVALVANFDPSPFVGDETVFEDGSTDATGWLWDFGDGVTSTATNPLHIFLDSDQKIVTLTVTNRNGADTTSVVVDPRLKPFADFAVSNSAPRGGESVDFTDLSVNPVAWDWDFGDGSTSAEQSPSHAYGSEGSYFVTLTITSATGDIDTSDPKQITVDPAPPLLAAVTANPDLATTLEVVVFDAETAAQSGPIDLYEIDFGDGSAIESAASSQFTHPFLSANTYMVMMRARGPLLDWSDWVSTALDVVDPPLPNIAIAASVPAAAEIGSVSLEAEFVEPSGPVVLWTWEITGGGLPDPVALSGQMVSYNFAAAGAYTIAVTAHGPVASTTESQSLTIVLPEPPAITALLASPSPVTIGLPVTFTPTVTGTVVTWEWDYLDDGNFVVGSSAGAFTFASSGSYPVTLRVTGPFGQTDTTSVVVVAYAPPVPTEPQPCPAAPITTGDALGFTSSDSTGTAVTWDWSVTKVGDPSVSYPDAGPSISHTFATAGTWDVVVTATGPSGATGSNSCAVTVEDPPPPLTAGITSDPPAGLMVTFFGSSTGPAVDTWSWDFGDLTSGSGQFPTAHTYGAPGTYTVILTVMSGSEMATAQLEITVS